MKKTILSVCSILIVGIFISACSTGNETGTQTSIQTQANNAVPQANPLNKWQTIQSVIGEPHPRHEATFVEYKGKFYSLGGRGVKPVDIYDPQTNKWTHGSKPPFDIHHFQAVVYQDAIVIAGAMQGRYPRETPIPNIIHYYPEQDKWEIKEVIPENRRRGGAGSVIVGDKLYLIAGIQNGHVGGFIPWLDSFDLKTKQWKVLADAPRPRDHFQAAAAKGKIYAAGGRTTSQATKQVFQLVIQEIDEYDISSDQWVTLNAKLPVGRAGNSSLIVGNDLWVLGGETIRATPAHNEVDILNLDTLELSSFNPMVEGRHGTGAVLYDNAVWTCCGSGTRGGSIELKTIEKIEL